MRIASISILLLALSGFAFAQDTNFSSGPQYLITSDSPLLLQPISTPSLSLSTPVATTPAAETPTTQSATAETAAPAPSQSDLARIYWSGPPASQTVSEIEITNAEPPRALPASFFDTGVTGMTTAETLRERGYDVPLGDTARYWKARKHATRVFTNADVQRVHAN